MGEDRVRGKKDGVFKDMTQVDTKESRKQSKVTEIHVNWARNSHLHEEIKSTIKIDKVMKEN